MLDLLKPTLFAQKELRKFLSFEENRKRQIMKMLFTCDSVASFRAMLWSDSFDKAFACKSRNIVSRGFGGNSCSSCNF